MTGYGRSTRPSPMNDPCNLSEEQKAFIPKLIAAPCWPNIPTHDDDGFGLGRHRRGGESPPRHEAWTESLSLDGRKAGPEPEDTRAQPPENGYGWSCWRLPIVGSRRSTRLPTSPKARPDEHPVPHRVHRKLGPPSGMCRPVRIPPSDSIWTEMLASDPVGATWGAGVRRAPRYQPGVSMASLLRCRRPS